MLTNREVESLVHRILSGKLIFNFNDLLLELRKPSLSLRLKSDILYKEAYESNLYDNFWLIEDIPNLAINIGLLSPNYKEDLKKFEKKLDSQKVALFKDFSDKNQRKKNKQKIADTKRYLNDDYNRLHYLDYLSLEHYCEKIKNEFIIINTLYVYENGKLFFDSKPIDYNLFNSAMTYISNHIITIENYKEIARHEYWKNLWNNNKFDILPETVNEWSEEQKTMFNISTMYDRIYEHPECPSQDIIEDDDALDGWVISQKLENNKQKNQKGVDNILSDRIRNSSEIFLTPTSAEDISDIQELNSADSRDKTRQKFNFILANKDKTIQESELPDVQERIKQELYQHQKRKG